VARCASRPGSRLDRDRPLCAPVGTQVTSCGTPIPSSLGVPFLRWTRVLIPHGPEPARFSPNRVQLSAGVKSFASRKQGSSPSPSSTNDSRACATLLLNRLHCNVVREDFQRSCTSSFDGADLLAAGVPCPPFSKTGRQGEVRASRLLWTLA